MADEAEQVGDGFDTVAWPDAWPDGDVGGGEGGDNEDDGEDEPKVALFGRDVPRKRMFIAAGVAAAVLLAGIGGCAVLGRQPEPAATVSRQQADQAAAGEAEPEDKAMYVNVGVTAEGWDEATSSPVIAHIESDDGDVDFYHAFPANQAEPVAVGDESSCKVTYVSPVNADGSIYKVGESKTLASSEEKPADAAATAATLEKVEAAGVTADDLTNIATQVTEAVKKGDSTLTGDKGSQVVSKVEENIKNSPAAADDVKQSVEQQAGQAQEEAKKEETTAKVPTTRRPPAPAQAPTAPPAATLTPVPTSHPTKAGTRRKAALPSRAAARREETPRPADPRRSTSTAGSRRRRPSTTTPSTPPSTMTQSTPPSTTTPLPTQRPSTTTP